MAIGSNTEWEYWGDKDPLWGVASWKGKKKGGNDQWEDEEFYELGKQDWKDFLQRWDRYEVVKERVVEIGCGAGRLTKQLAASFNSVAALDVSQGMIDYAKSRLENPNIEFYKVEGTEIPLPNNSVSGIFTTHVMQHLDSVEHINQYFKEFYRTLSNNGTIMIHIPVHEWPFGEKRFHKAIHSLMKVAYGVKAALQRGILKMGVATSLMKMNSYSIEKDVFNYLTSLGFKDIELLVFKLSSNGDPHPFIFARKIESDKIQ